MHNHKGSHIPGLPGEAWYSLSAHEFEHIQAVSAVEGSWDKATTMVDPKRHTFFTSSFTHFHDGSLLHDIQQNKTTIMQMTCREKG